MLIDVEKQKPSPRKRRMKAQIQRSCRKQFDRLASSFSWRRSRSRHVTLHMAEP
jgi:hypothetical protein